MCFFIIKKRNRDIFEKEFFLNREKYKNSYVRIIKKYFPKLKILKLKQYSEKTIFSVNNKILFKFNENVKTLQKEQLISQILKKHVKSIKIPNMKLINDDEYPFICYSFIRGRNISSKKLNPKKHKQLGKDIAMFLYELHSINLDNIELENIECHLNFFELKDIEELINFFALNENILNNHQITYDNVKHLLHNDLHEGQLILNRQHKLVGIVDFNLSGVDCNFCYDFIRLGSDYNLLKIVIDKYSELTGYDKNILIKNIVKLTLDRYNKSLKMNK